MRPVPALRRFPFETHFFPKQGEQVKSWFEMLKVRIDLMSSHCRDDAHQDHRQVCRLTWNTFRYHCIILEELAGLRSDVAPGLPAEVPDVECSYSVSMKIFLVSYPRWFEGKRLQREVFSRAMEIAPPCST
jgi:hypothetical protein